MHRFLNIFLITLFFFTSSCTTNNQFDLEKRNTEEFYVGSGVVSYFLPTLPKWANYSEVASCKRGRSIQYLNFDKMKQSFNITYKEFIQFQLMYNTKVWKNLDKANLDFIPFKDAERIFYETNDLVRAGAGNFKPPRFKRVHIVWVDDFISNRKKIEKLKNAMNGSEMVKGFPIFFSLCMSRIDLIKFIKSNKLDLGSYEMLTYDMLSPYNQKGEKGLGPYIDLTAFMGNKLFYFFGSRIPSSVVAKRLFFRKL